MDVKVTETMPKLQHSLVLSQPAVWKYETEEFHGICEIAHDQMTIKCVFESHSNKFYDVLAVDGIVRYRLVNPVSVERLAEQLLEDFPDLRVTVMGRAKTHGWITSTVGKRFA
jgi:hypothetical protein